MSMAPCHGSVEPGQLGELGKAVEQGHDLDHRAGLAPAGRRLDAGQARGADGVGVGEDAARADLLPGAGQDDAGGVRALGVAGERGIGDGLLLDQNPLDRRGGAHGCAGLLGGGAERPGHGAHAAAGVAPRALARRPPAEVVVEADEGGAGVLGRRERADQALERERHLDLLRRDAAEVVGDRAVEDLGSDCVQPALAVGRLEQQRPRARRRLVPALGPGRVAVGVARATSRPRAARACARGSTR